MQITEKFTRNFQVDVTAQGNDTSASELIPYKYAQEAFSRMESVQESSHSTS